MSVRTCLPSSMCGPLANTVSTQLGSLKVTNPKPRDLPVAGFFITTQSITSPYRLKYFNIEPENRLMFFHQDHNRYLSVILYKYIQTVSINFIQLNIKAVIKKNLTT